MFGMGTFKRPWQRSGEPMEVAIGKAEAAFEFFSKLGIDYYSHDTDVAPEGSRSRSTATTSRRWSITSNATRNRPASNCWGTANCFSNPRCRRRE